MDRSDPALDLLKQRVDLAALGALTAAAEALVGPHPERACATLAAWRRLDLLPMHGVGEAAVWALHPLGVPSATPIELLGSLLDGDECEPDGIRQAFAWARGRIAAVGEPTPLPEGAELIKELWRRSLLDAVADFGAATVRLCSQVRVALETGSAPVAAEAVARARPELVSLAERIRSLADQVTGAPVRLAPTPMPGAPAPPEPPEHQPALIEETPDLVPVDDVGGFGDDEFDDGGFNDDDLDDDDLDDGEFEYMRVRERTGLAIGFLVLTTAMALLLLSAVVYGWPSLLG